MASDLQQALITLGFSERDALIYLALLRFGKSGAPQLALATGVPRASCYDVLESLVVRGLARSLQEGEQRVFLAEPPERLQTYLNVQLQEMENRVQALDRLMPQLLSLTSDGAVRPGVRILTTEEDLRQTRQDFFDSGEPLLQIVGYDAFKRTRSERALREQFQELKMKKTRGRIMYVTDEPVEDIDWGFEVRKISPSLLDVPGEISVYADRTALFSYTHGLVGVEIISGPIAATCKAVLELAWRQAQEIAKLS